jgi:pSer/pThr/pTyr-binding forkhead associated (FHA) protein
MSSQPTIDRAAMLFCPPLPPLRLDRSRPVCIGRQPTCELPLRRDDVSRRHAELRFEGGSWTLQDLNSTNGTYLNGERIDAVRRLAPGDRIEIGANAITFCEIDARAGAAARRNGRDDAMTVIQERPPEPRQAFGGELAQIPPPALFQLLEMGSNSGLLEIDSEAGSVRVWFAGGRPIHAESEKQLGFEAALVAINVTRGSFRFAPDSTPPEQTLTASVTELLLEACRIQDEEGRG